MIPDRDELWADMTQFDTHLADSVWEGELRDPDTPGWYAELVALIRRARGPAEPHELVDEPAVVDTMRRAALGDSVYEFPRRRLRTAARMVAVKLTAAVAATGMTGIAAAATTGIVATVAATVVVPALNERVLPVLREHITPVGVSPTAHGVDHGDGPSVCDGDHTACSLEAPDPVVVDAPDTQAAGPSGPTPARGDEAQAPAAIEPAPTLTAPAAPTTTTTAAPTTETATSTTATVAQPGRRGTVDDSPPAPVRSQVPPRASSLGRPPVDPPEQPWGPLRAAEPDAPRLEPGRSAVDRPDVPDRPPSPARPSPPLRPDTARPALGG